MKKGALSLAVRRSGVLKQLLKTDSTVSSTSVVERLNGYTTWSNNGTRGNYNRILPHLFNTNSTSECPEHHRLYNRETGSQPRMLSVHSPRRELQFLASDGLADMDHSLQVSNRASEVAHGEWTEQCSMRAMGSLVGQHAGAIRGIGQHLHGPSFGAGSGLAFASSNRRGFFGSSANSAPASPVPAASPTPDPSTSAVEPPPIAEGGLVSSVTGFFEGWKLPESWSPTVEAWKKYYGDTIQQLPPPVQEALNPSNPYFQTVVQESAIFLAFIGAWTLLPRYLRSIHRQVGEHATFLGDKVAKTKAVPQPIPYEHSMFNAIEDPARFIISLVAFTHAAVRIAPRSDLGTFLNQAWGGGLVLSFVWFLYRWKSNYFARALSGPVDPMEREKLRSLDRVSSVGLGLLAALSVAETSGFAVQSILTVGGIGGVATAFAARDVIGNVLSGAMLYFYQPFNVGDTIMAGNVKGKVVDVGLHSTQLLNSDKHPVSVPNSFFSSQVIVNESRATHRGFTTRVPLLLDDLGKIPLITRQVRGMLVNHPKVFTGEGMPRCFLSGITGSHVEVTINCSVPTMSKDEFLLAEEEILYDVARIINELDARIGENSPREPSKRQVFDFAKCKDHPEIPPPSF